MTEYIVFLRTNQMKYENLYSEFEMRVIIYLNLVITIKSIK